jgi:hypothetical protein
MRRGGLTGCAILLCMGSMLVVAGLFLICQCLGVVGLCLAIRQFTNAKQAELQAKLEDAIHDWVDSPGKDAQDKAKPSKLAISLDAMGAVVGVSAAKSLMNSLQVETSHTARAANGVSDVLEAQKNPIIGLLAGGKRGKGAAIARLTEVLSPMFSGTGAGSGASSPSDGNHQRPMSL